MRQCASFWPHARHQDSFPTLQAAKPGLSNGTAIKSKAILSAYAQPRPTRTGLFGPDNAGDERYTRPSPPMRTSRRTAVIDALCSTGLVPDGRLTALSPYENCVHLAHQDEGD